MAQKKYLVALVSSSFSPIPNREKWTDDPMLALNSYFKEFIAHPTVVSITCFNKQDAIKLLDTFISNVTTFNSKYFENGTTKGYYKAPLQYYYTESMLSKANLLNSNNVNSPNGFVIHPFRCA